MYSKRSLIGIAQERIDDMFKSFDLSKVESHALVTSKGVKDKRLLAWVISQPEVKVIQVGLQPNITTNQKELIVKDIQSGLITACIKDEELALEVEKFLLKSLTLKDLRLSDIERSALNLVILPKLRAEKGVWGSESMIEIVSRLFIFNLVFELSFFDEFVARTLSTAGKLNDEHESKIARLDSLMLDHGLVLQFGSPETPFKNTAFLYNRISERVYKSVRYLDKPYQAKTLKVIYDADILENKLEDYEQLAQRYSKLSKKTVANAIGELNTLAKEFGIEKLIYRTNEEMPTENYPYLNPSLYCKTVKSVRLARKQQQKTKIK
jgi:hypothetical protein